MVVHRLPYTRYRCMTIYTYWRVDSVFCHCDNRSPISIPDTTKRFLLGIICPLTHTMASLAPSHRQSQSSVQTFLSNDYPETNHTIYGEVLSWFPAESERLVEAERVAEADLTNFSSSTAKSWNLKAKLQGSLIAEIKDREMASGMEARRAKADLNDKIIGALHGVLNRLG